MPSASRSSSNPASTASAPRSPTAGATAPARARASGTISARIWSTRRSSCSAHPRALFLDLAAQRDAATTDDRFHALLRYDRLRVSLHATTLAAAETPRFALHGTRGSWVKYGTDPQEAALKTGTLPGGHGWGIDPRPGTLTTATGSEPLPSPPGDYGTYYRAIRDAIRGTGPNPVTPAEALAVMTVLELGRASDEQRRELAVRRPG